MSFSIDAIYAALRQQGAGGDGIYFALSKGNRIDAILDTPRLWGHDPSVTDYIPAAGDLRSAITTLVASATGTLDIAVLFPFPSGHFLDAVRAGLQKADPRTQIRVTAGFYFPIPPAQSDPVQLIDAFLQALDPPAGMTVHVALIQSWATSWNHAKILIADGGRVITGGHNHWSDDYTQFAPVHDVSFAFSGPAASTAEVFLNHIWRRMWWDRSETPETAQPLFWSRQGPVSAPTWSNRVLCGNVPAASGSTGMLALGRAGMNLDKPFPPVASDNASEAAKIMAVRLLGTGHLRLSQQMLGGSPLGDYDGPFFDVLCDHVIGSGTLSLILAVPADVSVTGFDGIELGGPLARKLTTVAQPSRTMGVLAAGLVLDVAAGRRKPQALTADVTFIVGETVAPPAAQRSPSSTSSNRVRPS